jgi:hypothetical protein
MHMLTAGEIAGIILGTIAIILAIVVPTLIERARRPHLVIRTVNDIPNPGQTTRFLHCRVVNEPHLHILSTIERNSAYDTKVRLTFFRNEERILGPIEAKWTNAPECRTPITQIVVNQPPTPIDIRDIDVFDSTKTIFSHSQIIPADIGGRAFDVVLKNQTQNECYALTGWSYRFEDLADPNLMIPNGTFRVEMEAVSSNALFILRNTGPNIADISLGVQ